MKILQVIPRLGIGGIEKETLEICEELNVHGVESHIAASSGSLSKTYDFAKNSIKYHKMSLRGANPILILLNIFRLAFLIKKEKIDIIHARSKSPAWSAFFAAKLTQIPFVTTVHVAYKNDSFFKKAFNKIMVKGKKVIAISDFIENYIKTEFGLGAKNGIVKIVRGVNVKHYASPPEKSTLDYVRQNHFQGKFDKVIFFPARFSPGKGHEFFLKSFAISQLQNKTKVKVIFSGSGNSKYRNHLYKLIENLGLTSKVEFLPEQQDIKPFYFLSDIVVCPSVHPEAFGRVACEAALAQTPVIASNIGGFCEIIIPKGDGKTGWLTKCFNHENFANILDEVLKLGDDEKKAICQRAQSRIEEHFDVKKMVQRLYQTYENLI